MFYGSKIDPVEINSENIRNLNRSIASKSIFTMGLEEDTNQVIIAIPAEYTLSKIVDNNAFGIDILEKFDQSVVSVQGATAGYETDYKVYVYNPNTPLGANTYTLSF